MKENSNNFLDSRFTNAIMDLATNIRMIFPRVGGVKFEEVCAKRHEKNKKVGGFQ